MSVPFPEPTAPRPSRAEVLLDYLDYFRSVIIDKLQGLPDHELRASRLGSRWTPLGLLKHLTYVELRWIVWGFAGRPVAEPWGDSRDGRWFVPEHESLPELVDALQSQAAHTRDVVEAHDLSERGAPGPRWPDAEPATLERVLLHLLQEYARHAGHLDIVRELIDGRTGE
ncbi:DinB family protein [Pseudonocardia kunmingensis]|uniref:Uncharacterized protein DUF664 n=1 Tax=Pseudonocardia kunmingensis TaxID=630975 RepID=A0A543DNX9_9PSEU|nr:DinB family protein [Pseudonocardia kunmingensis]TQM11029.1 uncharacterized protein DUF664 [Pseudonocardia kunmingensis]